MPVQDTPQIFAEQLAVKVWSTISVWFRNQISAKGCIILSHMLLIGNKTRSWSISDKGNLSVDVSPIKTCFSWLPLSHSIGLSKVSLFFLQNTSMVIIAQYLFVHCYNGFHLEMIGNVCQKNVVQAERISRLGTLPFDHFKKNDKGYLFQIVGCFSKYFL